MSEGPSSSSLFLNFFVVFPDQPQSHTVVGPLQLQPIAHGAGRAFPLPALGLHVPLCSLRTGNMADSPLHPLQGSVPGPGHGSRLFLKACIKLVMIEIAGDV